MKIGNSVWYCKKLATPDASGNDYAAPIEIKTRIMYFTVMGKRGGSDIFELGDTTSSELTAIAQPYDLWKDTFNIGTLFYCNGASPTQNEAFYGQTANYEVDDIDFGNARIKLNLKRTRN